MCSGLFVAGITQVTAGSASIYLRNNCAQLAQSNSRVQSGKACPQNPAEQIALLKGLVDDNRDTVPSSGR